MNRLGETKEEMWQRMEQTVQMLTGDWEEGLCYRMKQRVEEVDPANSSAVFSIPTVPWMAAREKFVHGGIIGAIMDQGLGYLGCCYAGYPTLTVNLNVSYLRSVPVGDRMFVRARIMQAGKSFITIQGEAWLESDPDRFVACANGTFYARATKRSDEQMRTVDDMPAAQPAAQPAPQNE